MAETTNNTTPKKAGFLKFFRETKAEMKKVSWPTKEQLLHNTLIILIFIAIATVILSVLDVGFSWLFQLLTKGI
ncbi:MAG: preprotein translocase subunit SecE [Ruminococcaceae bacterium]|nr:preprotein translocase subunit SecE [Oscillospiraceae bacterium]